MEIELYLVPNDKEGELLKNFLERNNLLFKEIVTEDINLLNKISQTKFDNKISLLRIKYSHSIHIIRGFNPWNLKQLLEHIEKYQSKTKSGHNIG